MPKMYFKSKKTGKLTPFFGASPNNKDYNNLNNKPKINGVTLQGEKTAKDIGLVSPEELDKKVDKINESEKVYATDKFGRTTSIQYNETPYGSGLAKRTSGGQVKTTDPVADDDSTPKKYVEEHYTDKATTELLQKEVDHLKSNVLDFVEDDSTAYIKDVPAGASPKAMITEIGGNTYKTTNLLKFPYYQTDINIPITINGLTITVKNDGSLLLNGTVSDGFNFNLKNASEINNPYNLKPNTTYRLKADNIEGRAFLIIGDGNSGLAYTYGTNITFKTENLPEIKYKYSIFAVETGATFNNEIIRPLITEGEAEKEWSEWFAGLKDTKCTAVKPLGANLIDFKSFLNEPMTVNGITYSKVNDYIVNVRGRVIDPSITSSIQFINIDKRIYHSGYYSTQRIELPSGDIEFYTRSLENDTNIAQNNVYQPNPFKIRGIGIYVNSDITEYININIFCGLTKGSTVKVTPYIDLPSLHIPQEVQNIKNYGKSYTKMDFKNFIDQAMFVPIDKKKIIQYPPDYSTSYVYTDSLIDASGAYDCTDPRARVIFGYPDPDVNSLVWEDTGIPTLEEFLTTIPENCELIYKTNTVRITPVSQYFPKGGAVEVQGGGSIIAENKEKQPVPSRILYSVNRKPKLQMPQQLKVVGTTASWVAVPNATNYTLFIDSTLMGSIATVNRDLATLPAWSTISSGTHTLNVIATANDYADSDTAMVNFVKG